MADEPVRCEICGRKLRSPESKAIGRGRVCDAKVRPVATAAAPPPRSGRRSAAPAGPDLFTAVNDQDPEEVQT